MSASAIADGFVTMIGSASLLGAHAVRKDSYEVLETSASACCVIQLTGATSESTTFSNTYSPEQSWGFSLDVFVRDTGNSQAAMNKVWAVTDNIMNTIEADSTIQGTADSVRSISYSRDPERLLNVGGAIWLPMKFDVNVIEWE